MDNGKKRVIIISVAAAVIIAAVCTVIGVHYSGTGDYGEYGAEKTTAEQEDSSKKNDYSAQSYIEVSGDNAGGAIDIALYAKRAYELKYQFAVDSFESAADISVNKIVQYAFCHMFNDALTDKEESDKPVYRKATAEEINKQITALFGITGVDIQNSDLYNSSSQIFEMWEPNNGAAVFAKANSIKLDETTYEVQVELCTNKALNLAKDTVVLTLKQDSGNFVIEKMLTK